MNYIELSIKDAKEKCKDLYKKVKQDYNYDLVIFIAKGSYIIGKELSKLNNVPLLEIQATRRGGKLKKILKPIMRLLPKNFLIKLREKEMKSDFHKIKQDRKISYNKKEYEKYSKVKQILLVDDSIDSGNSIIQVKKALEKIFPNSKIKTAVFNVMNKSVVKPDYTLYQDMMICGPWSSDSKENKEYLKLYSQCKRYSSLSQKNNISVAMATYNGEKFLQKQIDSILNNLDEEDELIISDDGSTDNTIKIIKDYIKKDQRITLLNGPKKGVIKNFENALRHCSGKYIFLSDQDDIWTSDKKKIILSYFEKEKVIAIVHDAIVIDENGNKIMDSWFIHRNSKRGLIANILKNRYLGCCMAFDRNLLKFSLPIPDGVEMHDWWLGLCAELNGKTKFINHQLLGYRRHNKNVSSLTHYGLLKMIKNRIYLIFYLLKRRFRSDRK